MIYYNYELFKKIKTFQKCELNKLLLVSGVSIFFLIQSTYFRGTFWQSTHVQYFYEENVPPFNSRDNECWATNLGRQADAVSGDLLKSLFFWEELNPYQQILYK